MKRIQFLALTSIFIGTFVAMLMGELLARYYFYGEQLFNPSYVNSFHNLFSSNLVQKSSNDTLIYELKPNYDECFKGVQVSTNELGFRQGKHDTAKKQVAVIGDSFTMGSGVVFQDVYVEQANQVLDACEIQLLNFGVSGYNLNQYLSLSKKLLKQQSFDYLIWGFCQYNDHLIPGKDYPKFEYHKESTKPTFYTSHLYVWLQAMWRKPGAYMHHHNEAQLNYVDTIFKELSRLAKHHHIPAIIYLLGVDHRPKQLVNIKHLATKHDLIFVDGTSALKDKDVANMVLSINDSHPNSLGHKYLSLAIANYFKENCHHNQWN